MRQTLGKMMPSRARWYAQFIVARYRQVTWSSRGLPDFIIIGAQKAGTSSLYAYLAQHPQLFPSFKKEVHFFDGGLNPSIDDYRKGSSWYRAHFPLQKKIGENGKSFEASPLYLFNPLAPQRIAQLVPEVKIIALLRNPTERAISHYFHEKRRGREPLTIEEALRSEESRLEPVVKASDYKNNVFIHHSYKSRGLYKEQLERYSEHFSNDRILVISSEQLFATPAASLKRVFEFVGVDPDWRVGDLKPRNVANNRTEVTPRVYDYLDGFFRNSNDALYNILGEDYGW